MRAYLPEANILGVFSEALTAYVETVLADHSMIVGASPAADKMKNMAQINDTSWMRGGT